MSRHTLLGAAAMPRLRWSGLAALVLASSALPCRAAPRGGALAGDRPRVIVSTDVGGSDPDDFQSMVHLLRGAPGEPMADHWGGAFVRTDHGPHYWTDDPAPALREGKRPGAKTVSRWREDYLRDWERRMDRTGGR